MGVPRWPLLSLLLAISLYARVSGEERDKQQHKPELAPPQTPRTTKEVRELLSQHVTRFPGIKDEKVTFKEALDLLSKGYSLQFAVDQAAFRAEVPPVPDIMSWPIARQPILPIANRSLYSTLRIVLDRVSITSGTAFVIRGNVIVVTTNQALAKQSLRAEPPPDERTAKRAKELRTALSRRVEFPGFAKDERLTFADVLDQLAKLYALSFEVNETAFRAEVPPLPEVLNTPMAEKQGLPRTDNTTPMEVLRVVLARLPGPSGATFLIRHDCIEITTTQFVQAEKSGVSVPSTYPPRLLP